MSKGSSKAHPSRGNAAFLALATALGLLIASAVYGYGGL